MEKSGLFDLLQNHLIGNLVDYVTGVETGLDSNGRKNRGGHLMEDLRLVVTSTIIPRLMYLIVVIQISLSIY